MPAAGSAIVSYAWDFGDGTGENGATASHQFALDGTFPVVLTVKDTKGGTARTTRSVTATKSHTARRTPPRPPSGSADFDARRSGPGVVRWWSFDSDADLGGIAGAGPNAELRDRQRGPGRRP